MNFWKIVSSSFLIRKCLFSATGPPPNGQEEGWNGEGEKDALVGGFKPSLAEDGRFEIGDIHEKGLFNGTVNRSGTEEDEYDDYDDFGDDLTSGHLLKRSHSTGDLCFRRGRGAGRRDAGEPR